MVVLKENNFKLIGTIQNFNISIYETNHLLFLLQVEIINF